MKQISQQLNKHGLKEIVVDENVILKKGGTWRKNRIIIEQVDSYGAGC